MRNVYSCIYCNFAAGRMSGVNISTSVPTGTESHQFYRNMPCAYVKGALGKGETRRIKCKEPVLGRFLRIYLQGETRILTLCEVQVYGKIIR